ncbi:MAG: universal stress protein [Bacteroidetes bacterium]|nr:universal stress protein [Bacteroidota bacterium]
MYELQSILVPTDFSPHADDALEYAVSFGERNGAEITLLHVDEFNVSPLGAAGVRDEAVAAYQRRKGQFFEERFQRARAALEGRNVRLRTQLLSGRAYKVIVEESERLQYDLIIIPTRGLTHLSENLIGGTAERVVRLSRQPVLSILRGPRIKGGMNSVLCPTDLSPAGNVALSYALSIARRRGAKLYLQYISELDRPEAESEIRKRFPNLSDHHPQAGEVTIEYIFDRDVEPSNSIIRFADDRDVDLIVMSTHGRKGLRRVYIGNTAAEVVRQSARPVLTITHPFHRKMFARPVTEKATTNIPGIGR